MYADKKVRPSILGQSDPRVPDNGRRGSNPDSPLLT